MSEPVATFSGSGFADPHEMELEPHLSRLKPQTLELLIPHEDLAFRQVCRPPVVW